MNIFLIKQTSLGDVVHGTAAIRSVRVAHPDAKVTVLTSTTALPVLENNRDIDTLLTFDRYRVKSDWWRRPGWTLAHIVKTATQIRCTKFDLAIDLQGSWKTVMFLWAARAQKRFVKGRWLFARGFRNRRLHAIDEMDGVLRLAGIVPSQKVPVLSVSDASRAAVTSVLGSRQGPKKKLAIFCPITRWPTKNWPLERFSALAKRLQDEFFVVFTGSNEDREVLETLSLDLSADHALSLGGRLSLNEFFALMERADLVVTGDSLPMHLASSFNVPLVALFGPTEEARVAPRNKRSVTVRARDDCFRCYRRTRCAKNCIADIQVEDVEGAVATVLARQG